MEIVHEMLARATTPETVYAALTEQTGLSAWFTTDTKAEPIVGSKAEFGFDRGQYSIKVEVVRLEAARLVQWKLVQGMPGWADMQALITWELRPHPNGTIVHFSHDGWASHDGPFGSVSYKWACFMTSLRAYVETGTGAPVS